MASNDDLGGYTLNELLGLDPVAKPPEKKQSLLSKIIGAPFRLIVALIKLPITIVSRIVGGIGKAIGELVRLPVRMLKALASPWTNRN